MAATRSNTLHPWAPHPDTTRASTPLTRPPALVSVSGVTEVHPVELLYTEAGEGQGEGRKGEGRGNEHGSLHQRLRVQVLGYHGKAIRLVVLNRIPHAVYHTAILPAVLRKVPWRMLFPCRHSHTVTPAAEVQLLTG